MSSNKNIHQDLLKIKNAKENDPEQYELYKKIFENYCEELSSASANDNVNDDFKCKNVVSGRDNEMKENSTLTDAFGSESNANFLDSPTKCVELCSYNSEIRSSKKGKKKFFTIIIIIFIAHFKSTN